MPKIGKSRHPMGRPDLAPDHIKTIKDCIIVASVLQWLTYYPKTAESFPIFAPRILEPKRFCITHE